uniref:Uncharacterized protein n=1 Tax=Arundo donax TaxID=35708 RepID=A0A0A8YAB7_ARUDO
MRTIQWMAARLQSLALPCASLRRGRSSEPAAWIRTPLVAVILYEAGGVNQ